MSKIVSIPAPAAYNRAARLADELAMQLGELANSIADHKFDDLSDERLLDFPKALKRYTDPVKSPVDESTRYLLVTAMDAVFSARFDLDDLNFGLVQTKLWEAQSQLDKVTPHVNGLFHRLVA